MASVAVAVVLLSGCGQKGPLTLPTDPEFKQRATLPDIVRRQWPGNPSSATSTPTPAPEATSPAPAASSPTSR